MGTKLSPSTEQQRTDSFIVRGAIIFAVTYVAKEMFQFELDNRFIEACIVIVYALYNIIAAYNNPKDKNNF